jgi:hypothetical protein
MEPLVTELSPQVSPEEQVSSELIKRMRKSRWTGVEIKPEKMHRPFPQNLAIAPRHSSAAIQAAPRDELMSNRKAKIERNIAELIRAFPLAFSTEPKQIKPLAIGIRQRISARCNLSLRKVDDALRLYTGQVEYSICGGLAQ